MTRRVELVVDLDFVYAMKADINALVPTSAEGRWLLGRSWLRPLVAAAKECLEAEEDGLRSSAAEAAAELSREEGDDE